MKKPEIFICECHTTEHQIVLFQDTYIEGGEEFSSVYIHVMLNKKPLLERIFYGIRYIFGYQSRFGAFDEIILNPEDADRLQEVVDHLRNSGFQNRQKVD